MGHSSTHFPGSSFAHLNRRRRNREPRLVQAPDRRTADPTGSGFVEVPPSRAGREARRALKHSAMFAATPPGPVPAPVPYESELEPYDFKLEGFRDS